MSKVKTTCQVDNYDEPAKTTIKVHSHWNSNRLVVIKVGEEERTVAASELKKAIDNCTNT